MSTLLLRSVRIFVSRICPESETLISVSGMMLKSKLVRKLYLWLPELEAASLNPKSLVRLFWLEYPTEVKKATFSVPPEILTLYCCWGDTPASKIRFM